MKKIILVMTMVMALGFTTVGCGNNPKVAKESATSTATAEGKTAPITPTKDTNIVNIDNDKLNKELITAGTLLVATSPDYAPFESIDQDSGKMVGFDIDLMNKIGEITGLKIVYKQLAFDSIIASLQSGQIDCSISGFSYKADRDVLFSYSYYNAGQIAVVKKDSPIKTNDDLVGKKIGTALGSSGNSVAHTIKDAKISNVSFNSAFPTLLAGNFDAYICDVNVANEAAAQNPGLRVLDKQLDNETTSVIFKNGNTEIQNVVNNALVKFMQTPEYKDLLKKYKMDVTN